MYKKLLICFIICILCLSPIAAENWDSFAGGIDHTAFRDDSSDFVTNLWVFNFESSPTRYSSTAFILVSS